MKYFWILITIGSDSAIRLTITEADLELKHRVSSTVPSCESLTVQGAARTKCTVAEVIETSYNLTVSVGVRRVKL